MSYISGNDQSISIFDTTNPKLYQNVIPYANFASFPLPADATIYRLYYDISADITYRWDGSNYQVYNSGNGGVVDTIVAGTGINVNSADPNNPIVSVVENNVDINNLGGGPLSVANGGTDASNFPNAGILVANGTNAFDTLKTNFFSAVAPQPSDDSSLGYSIGSIWTDQNQHIYICTNNTLANATWRIVDDMPQNAGTGVGCFYSSDNTLGTYFRNVRAASSKVSVVANIADIDVDVVEANINRNNLSSTLTVPNGGTGVITIPSTELVVGNGASAINTITNVATNYALVSKGVGVTPAFEKLNLTNYFSDVDTTGVANNDALLYNSATTKFEPRPTTANVDLTNNLLLNCDLNALFSTDTEVHDNSTYASIGTLSNLTIANLVAGHLSNAIQFNGANQQINFSGTAQQCNFDTNDPWTVSFWFKSAAADANERQIISCMQGANGSGWKIAYHPNNPYFNVQLSSNSSANLLEVRWNVNINDGNYHFLTFVHRSAYAWTQGSVDMYLDSVNREDIKVVQNNSLTSSEHIYAGPTVFLCFSGQSSGGTMLNNAYLDDVSIFNFSMIESEVVSLYNNGTGYENYFIVDEVVQHTHTASDLRDPVAVAKGGTAISSYAIGDILYASAATTLSKLADVATGNALISGGLGVSPTYGKIGLGTHISGTLAVANGGTGAVTLTANGFLIGNGTSAVTSIKSNFSASSAPTTSDDNTQGYAIGSRWLDTTSNKEYVCTNASTGAAIWVETTVQGSSAASEKNKLSLVDLTTYRYAATIDPFSTALNAYESMTYQLATGGSVSVWDTLNVFRGHGFPRRLLRGTTNIAKRTFFTCQLIGPAWVGLNLQDFLIGFCTQEFLDNLEANITSGLATHWPTYNTANNNRGVLARFRSTTSDFQYNGAAVSGTRTGYTTDANALGNDYLTFFYDQTTNNLTLLWHTSAAVLRSTTTLSMSTASLGGTTTYNNNFLGGDIVPIMNQNRRGTNWDVKIVSQRELDALGYTLVTDGISYFY